MNLGEKIRTHRLSAGLTQYELGQRCLPVLAVEVISRYENGHIKPSHRNLLSLIRALGCEPSEILGNVGDDGE